MNMKDFSPHADGMHGAVIMRSAQSCNRKSGQEKKDVYDRLL